MVSNVSVKPQQQKVKYVARHIANAATTAAGLGVVGSCAMKNINIANNVCDSVLSFTNGTGANFKNTSKVFDFFANVGDKIFKKGSKLGNVMERYFTGKLPSGGRLADPVQIKALVSKSKTIGAIGLAAALVTLGLIGRAMYKSGKINGENSK